MVLSSNNFFLCKKERLSMLLALPFWLFLSFLDGTNILLLSSAFTPLSPIETTKSRRSRNYDTTTTTTTTTTCTSAMMIPSQQTPSPVSHVTRAMGSYWKSKSKTRLHYIHEPTEERANNGGDFLHETWKKNDMKNNKEEEEQHKTAKATSSQNTTTTTTTTAASFVTKASKNENAKTAVDELLKDVFSSSSEKKDLVFLFVGQYHADQFEEIVQYSQKQIQKKTNNNNNNNNIEIVVVLGGGVIGGGNELDCTDKPSMSLLCGNLPSNSYAKVFKWVTDEEKSDDGNDSRIPEDIDLMMEENFNNNSDDSEIIEQQRRPPSFVIFADPYAPLEELLTRLEEPRQQQDSFNTDNIIPPPIVAGGITVDPQQQHISTLAHNGHMLPSGSLIGVAFTGNVGFVTVVAQGCRPVGPTFVITKASSNTVLTELSGESAITQLEKVALHPETNERDKELIRSGELVCGIGSSDTIITCFDDDDDDDDDSSLPNSSNYDATTSEEDIDGKGLVQIEDDFLIRQIMGFQPKSGSIVAAAGGLKEGKTFRFHVRSARSAREDIDLMMKRAKTERLFSGSKGKPLAAFQFSCVGRGNSFYGESNVDSDKIKELFEDDDDEDTRDPPIAGFFANGEVGPVGIRASETAAKETEHSSDKTSHSTFLHGFTTVCAMLCDYSKTNSGISDEVSSGSIIFSLDDAWA